MFLKMVLMNVQFEILTWFNIINTVSVKEVLSPTE